MPAVAASADAGVAGGWSPTGYNIAELLSKVGDLSNDAVDSLLGTTGIDDGAEGKVLWQKAGKALLNGDRLAVNVTTLSDEVRLDRAITPGTQSAELTDHPRHILLTGATGFLGAFLLR